MAPNKTTLSVPASYQTPSFVPKAVMPMVEEMQRLNAAREEQKLVQFAQQKAMLDQKNQSELQAFDDDLKNIDPSLRDYPAVQHDIARKKQQLEEQIATRNLMFSMQGQPSGMVEAELKNLREQYSQNRLPTFENLDQYKTVQANWNQLRGKKSVLDNLNGLLDNANEKYQKIISAEQDGDTTTATRLKKELTEFATANIIKPLNSAITSSDAVSIGEMLTKFPSLLSLATQAQITGKSPFDFNLAAARWVDLSPSEKKDFASRFTDNLQRAYSSDPATFLKNATEASAVFTKTYNNQLRDEVINTTSPGVAKRMGATLVKEPINIFQSEPERPKNPLYTPNPFGQATVTSGAAGTMATPAQTGLQQPVKEELNPLNAQIKGSTIFRIKR